MSDQTTVTAKPCPRWLKILLVISLALNIGIASVFAGVALRSAPPERAAAPSPEGVAIIARALPVKYQRQLRQALRENRAAVQMDRETLGRLRDRLVQALRAEPFDINAVEAVFADQRTLLDGVLVAGHNEILKQIEQMPLADRRKFIRNLMGGRPPKTPPEAVNRP